MIRPLRKIHRLGIPVLLAAVLPALLLTIRQRLPAPATAVYPATASIQALPAAGSTGQRIEIRLPADLPEVLAYWQPPGSEDLDARSILIGRPSGPISALDIPASMQGGQVLLYCLPTRRIILRQPLTGGGRS